MLVGKMPPRAHTDVHALGPWLSPAVARRASTPHCYWTQAPFRLTQTLPLRAFLQAGIARDGQQRPIGAPGLPVLPATAVAKFEHRRLPALATSTSEGLQGTRSIPSYKGSATSRSCLQSRRPDSPPGLPVVAGIPGHRRFLGR